MLTCNLAGPVLTDMCLSCVAVYTIPMGKTYKHSNADLAKHLRERPNGKHDPRPRKQRTRRDERKHAIRMGY